MFRQPCGCPLSMQDTSFDIDSIDKITAILFPLKCCTSCVSIHVHLFRTGVHVNCYVYMGCTSIGCKFLHCYQVFTFAAIDGCVLNIFQSRLKYCTTHVCEFKQQLLYEMSALVKCLDYIATYVNIACLYIRNNKHMLIYS